MGWTPPSMDLLRKEAQTLYDPDMAEKVRSLCRNIADIALHKNIYSSEDDFHGELFFGINTPQHQTIYEHLSHLKFFEHLLPNKQLKILDLCCGNGEFSYLAKNKGHLCWSTEFTTKYAKNGLELSLIETQYQCLAFRRLLTRKILNVNSQEVLIQWDKPMNISESPFDMVYINQATFHFPEVDELHFWKSFQWSVFLENLVKLLSKDGMIFITLARPGYVSLSHYLRQFHVEYFDVFLPNNEGHWWPLLLIQANQIDEIRNIRRFSAKKENAFYSTIGPSNKELIVQRFY
jgi:SAM-dependent methyltransferase